MEFGVTYLDLRDLAHMCVMDSINFPQCKPMSYISVGRGVIPFSGRFGMAESPTDRRRSAQMRGNHGVIRGKSLAHDPMGNSIALDHIYRKFPTSANHKFPIFVVQVGRGSISLCMRPIGEPIGGSSTNGPKQ